MKTAVEIVEAKEQYSVKLTPCNAVEGFITGNPIFHLYLPGSRKSTYFYEIVVTDREMGAKKVYAGRSASQKWQYLDAICNRKITGFQGIEMTSIGSILKFESNRENIYIKAVDTAPLILEGEDVTDIRNVYELSTGIITEFELGGYEKIYIQQGYGGAMVVDGKKVRGFSGWKPEKTALGNTIRIKLEGLREHFYIREGEMTTVIKIDNEIVTEIRESFETSQGIITECKLKSGIKIYIKEGENSAMKIDEKKVTRVSDSFGTKETSLGIITEFELEDESTVFLREGERTPIKIVGKDVKALGITVDTALGLITYFTLSDDCVTLVRQGEENPLSLDGVPVEEIESIEDTSIGKISKFKLSGGRSYYIRLGEKKPFLIQGEEIIGHTNVGNGTLFTLITGKNIFIPIMSKKGNVIINTLQNVREIIGDSD